MTSPTQRSLAYLREQGMLAAVVEKWVAPARQRFDLFGFIDVVGIRETQQGVYGVQTTTEEHAPDRLEKAKGLHALSVWLAAGNWFEVHGWKKRRVDGRPRWILSRRQVFKQPGGFRVVTLGVGDE